MVSADDHDEGRVGDADHGERDAAPPVPAPRQDAAHPNAEHVYRCGPAAGQDRRDPPPHPAPPIGQIPRQQHRERQGHGFHVEVERDRPPQPRADQEKQETCRDQPRRGAVAPAPAREAAHPAEGDGLRRDHADVLQPEQRQAVRAQPVEDGQRPDGKLRVVAPERHGLDRCARVQVTMRDQVPGLVVDRKVPRQRVPVVKQGAPGAETDELDSQDGVADRPHPAGQRKSSCGLMLGGGNCPLLGDAEPGQPGLGVPSDSERTLGRRHAADAIRDLVITFCD